MEALTNPASRHFYISRRLRLKDTAPIKIENSTVYWRVSKWIIEEPQCLWMATKQQGIKLNKEAHALLKDALLKVNPEKHAANEKEALRRRATRNVRKKLLDDLSGRKCKRK